MSQVLRFFKYATAITATRLRDSDGDGAAALTAPRTVNPFLSFLTNSPDTTVVILSYLDPYHHCFVKERQALLKVWRDLGGAEEVLMQGHGGDVSKWLGVTVKGGRVAELSWDDQDLSGTMPAEIGVLDSLVELR